MFLATLGSIFYFGTAHRAQSVGSPLLMSVTRVLNFWYLVSGWLQLLPGARRSLLCEYPFSSWDFSALALSFCYLSALHSPGLSSGARPSNKAWQRRYALGGSGPINNCVFTVVLTHAEPVCTGKRQLSILEEMELHLGGLCPQAGPEPLSAEVFTLLRSAQHGLE